MKTCPFFGPLLPGLLAIGFLLAPVRAEEPAAANSDDLAALLAKLTQQYAQLAALTRPAEETSTAPSPGKPAAAPQAAGLNKPVLQTSNGLQPSAGLQGAARGLTPAEEWRIMFPRKQAQQ